MFFSKKRNVERYLVAGLGNPGMQYEHTRHNAGFRAADCLAEKHSTVFNRHKFDSVFAETEISGKRVIILKPQTFMNLSGKAISRISAFYRIPADHIIIMFDDISLDTGTVRIRRKGSAGGHNGMKDIMEALGTQEIPRIKIGVGERPDRESDLKDWVLGKIPSECEKDFEDALYRAAAAAEDIIVYGVDHAMNQYSK